LAALHKRPRRRLHLLASTSAIALILTALPVTFDLEPGGQRLTLKASSVWAESCCFLAGTLVRMADGRERPIENVSVGDCVRAPGGGQNRVTGVERPRLGRRQLYGFNGGPAFFTAEHPFMTLSGWKAVDPEATALETKNLRVAPLVAGDVLLAEPDLEMVEARAVGAEAGAPRLAPYRLVSIESTAADPETPLYNLLLDGDHRYFANGFLVHNKGEGGDSGGGEGGDSGGGEGGDSGGGEGGDSGGGEGGDSGGGEGGDSGGGEGGDSGGGEGGDSGGGEGGNSGSGEGGSSGESGSGGEGGESGEGGEGGESEEGSESGESGESGEGFGAVEQRGSDLTLEEESEAIAKGWQ